MSPFQVETGTNAPQTTPRQLALFTFRGFGALWLSLGAHPLLLPERRADLRGHAGRDTSDRQGGRFRRSDSGTAGRRSGRSSQRARRASVVRTTTRSEGRGRPSRDLSDSAIRRRSPRRSFTRISAAYQSLGSIPLPAYDVHYPRRRTPTDP